MCARYRLYRASRKLEKSGYRSWAHYRHNRDPDICRYANKIRDFYSKYPYVFQIQYTHHAYKLVADYGPGGQVYGYNEMRSWCDRCVRFKWRLDIHRVFKQTALGISNDEHEDWYFNEIGGNDYIYFAFQDEKDCIAFMLRWA